MPNIRDYSAPEGIGLRPSETGVEAAAAAARRGGSFFNQAAEAIGDTGRRIASTISDAGDVAVKYMDHREISAGAAKGTELMANATDAWNKIKSDPNIDPNDTTIAKKFLAEQVEPALEQFKSGFNTERSQQFAEQFVDRFRNQMFRDTTADMASLAKVAVSRNIATTVNSLSSMVANSPSESAIDSAIETYRHTLSETVGSSPNLDGVTAATVRSELGLKGEISIVKAGISGMITKNPNTDLDALQKKYGQYIDGAEFKMFQKAAQTQAKADLLQNKQLETYQRQQQERAANDSFSKVVTDNFSIDASGNKLVINPKAVGQTLDVLRKYPEAGAPAARAMLDFIESQQNKELKVTDDPTTRQDLTDRMFSLEKPTTTIDLMKARAQGRITDHTFSVMNGLVKELQETPLKGPVWQSTAAAVKDALIVTVPGIPGKDGKGTEAYASFMQSFLPDYIAKSRAGTLPPNALDTKDPSSMISQAMAPFKRTPAQRMQDWVGAAGGISSAPSERPGPAVAPPTKVSTPTDAEKLKPGTRYQTPDGKVYVR